MFSFCTYYLKLALHLADARLEEADCCLAKLHHWLLPGQKKNKTATTKQTKKTFFLLKYD